MTEMGITEALNDISDINLLKLVLIKAHTH